MSIELKQAAQRALNELSEARKIIRASSSRQLAKDWDRRATAALAGLRTAIQQAEAQQPATGEPVAWKYQPQDGLKHPAFTEHEAIAIAHGKDGSVVPLYTHPAPGVPDGYVLVPEVPTDEMLFAGYAMVKPGELLCPAWNAMLSAAQAQKP